MEPGNLDIAVPSSECAPLPSNIRVSNLGNLGKSAASFLCNWEFKDKNTGLIWLIWGHKRYVSIENWFVFSLDDFGQSYKGLPDAWSYFYPESKHLACLTQQTKRMINSSCAVLPMEWVHYNRTIMKYHEPSPSARISNSQSSWTWIHCQGCQGTRLRRCWFLASVFHRLVWPNTTKSDNIILKKYLKLSLNWGLWNRSRVQCCRYGDLSSWGGRAWAWVPETAWSFQESKMWRIPSSKNTWRSYNLGHCFHADWQVYC